MTKKTKQLELSEEYPFTFSLSMNESGDGRMTSAHAECYLKAKDLESRFVITYAFDPRVLVRTILGECGELPLLVCSHCGKPDCLDITRQKLSRSGGYVELEIEQSECRRFFRFTEDGYDHGAVFVLLEAYVEKLGWDFYSGCFQDYEDYKRFIDGFIEDPEFAALWKVEMEMHNSMKEFESRNQDSDR